VVRVVLCTCPPDRADELAAALVEARVAACVNLIPVGSVYRWQGAVERAAETLLLIKAPAEGVAALRDHLLRLHPYEVPEFVVLDVDDAASHAPYVDWVRRLGA
jgi:periplasmic divalent cation tolerance protein